ncbi:glycosyltransferase family 28 domain-containing protein [Truncatella angustata]|uniref:Glycosyltransferase family 28 domain-containing protein n=1 Tax=Truncatella angustata TaxID=152316 RepID=A0A9P8ZW09_9PEZI|nr:glycosyltransferase family 28 domain-containing protein [Truncatella angustata]KAH6651632.1 glycosyltransferase family 28 domain-containing protein [Truncatella angustata]
MSMLDSKRAQASSGSGSGNHAEQTPSYDDTLSATVSDGFRDQTALPDLPELGAEEEVPPAYSEVHDRLSLHQAGFDAGATVTDDGRVDINLNQTSRQLADIIAPTLRSQLTHDARIAAEAPLPPAYIPPSLGGLPGQTPPPRLNVVIQIVGSRGDVQPFISLGQILKNTYGHRVRIATHATFQTFVEENGLEFFSIGGDPAELMAFMVKNPGLMPGFDAVKSGEITKRRKGIEEIVWGCWRSCIEAGNGLGPAPRLERKQNMNPQDAEAMTMDPAHKPFVADAIIANPPSFAHIHVAEKLGVPLHLMFTMPWSPTRAFPQPLANIQSSNTDPVTTNYVSYALVEMMTWQGLGDVINRFRTKVLDLEPLSLLWAPGVLTRLRIPYTYCWSPALIPKPNDWGNHIDIAGFYFLNLASNYTPEPELAAFLEAGPPPVYIGFGSIVVDDPNGLTRMIFDAVAETGVRALVSKGWGGLGADSVGIPDGVFMLGNCPHDWLFKHVSAVCHHGGAGTTAAGIQAGKPTIVVPFFGDQPFWGAMVAKAGAGPEPIPYKKLTGEGLAEAIRTALKPETQERAKELGEKIREEKGSDVGGQSFHQHLDVDSLRCSVAPSRVAVWRVRRSNFRLSALAAAALVDGGFLQYSDLKLFRSREYSTEDEPWDPISAVTSALVGDIGSIGMAIADFPRDVFKAAKGRPKPKESSDNVDSPSTDTGAQTPGAAEHASTQVVPGTPGAEADRQLVSSPELTPTNESSLSLAQSVSAASALSSTSTRSTGHPPPPKRVRSESSTPQRGGAASPSLNDHLDRALGAGKSINNVVTTGVKTPMNFCLGLARGFRNAPKLYNDDTVRRPEKVTSFETGLKVAGKEFGLGMYDGISGLITQPLKGAQKEGGLGFLKGIGKGIGGVMLKPAAAVWSIPAYTMAGVHAEIRTLFAQSAQNYIVASRIAQGKEDLKRSAMEERQDIEARWLASRDDVKGFYSWRQKEKGKATSASPTRQPSPGPQGASADSIPARKEAPKTGWRNTRNMSFEDRKRLHEDKLAWRQRQAAVVAAAASGAHIIEDISASRPESMYESEPRDPEFEQAIQAAVRETSSGDPEEDARIEWAIRSSVMELRRRSTVSIASGISNHSTAPSTVSGPTYSSAEKTSNTDTTVSSPHYGYPSDLKHQVPFSPEDFENITDQEYQDLIEQAVQLSVAEDHRHKSMQNLHEETEDDSNYEQALQKSQQEHAPLPHDDEELRKVIAASEAEHAARLQQGHDGQNDDDNDDEELRKAIEASQAAHAEPSSDNADDEEELKRALEASEKAHQEELARAKADRTEEDIVMEYVKKQSLAEEQYRQKGKGTEAVQDDDELLRRAIEESMKATGKVGESSGAGAPPDPKTPGGSSIKELP